MINSVGPPYPTIARSSARNVHPSSSPLKMRYHPPPNLDDETDASANTAGFMTVVGRHGPSPLVPPRWFRPSAGDVRGRTSPGRGRDDAGPDATSADDRKVGKRTGLRSETPGGRRIILTKLETEQRKRSGRVLLCHSTSSSLVTYGDDASSSSASGAACSPNRRAPRRLSSLPALALASSDAVMESTASPTAFSSSSSTSTSVPPANESSWSTIRCPARAAWWQSSTTSRAGHRPPSSSSEAPHARSARSAELPPPADAPTRIDARSR
mmetsp:Transcript_2872/g.6625  ORF Transcript_2872/g.6625 Transcript_2872/m.6625 type:complete len:269 (+) Transcript_2872:578-1384(+)